MNDVPEPLVVEVLARLLMISGHIRPRKWSQAREDYYRLWLLLDTISERFRGRIVLYITDPLSLHGLFQITRHRIRHFPTFVIGGRETYTGWDAEEVSRRIERRLIPE